MKQKQILCTVRNTRRFFPAVCCLAMGLLAVTAPGCSADDAAPAGAGAPQHVPLHVASAGVRYENETQTETRAPLGYSALPINRGIGIFRSQGDGYDSESVNKLYAVGIEEYGWQPDLETDTVFLNAGDAEVCAYYPYSHAYTDKTAIPLTSAKYEGTPTDFDRDDICYAVNRTMNSYYRVTKFEMKRAMALVDFVIRKDAGFAGSVVVTAITLKNAALPASSTLDITSGTYGTPVKDSVTYNPGKEVHSPGADPYNPGLTISTTPLTSSVLLVPFTPATPGLRVIFTINGMPREMNIPLSSVASFEAGKRYSLQVTVTPASLQVTSISQLSWDEVGVGGDDYTWYPQQERRIDIGLPFYIAAGNLVGTKQSDGTITYGIAEEQGWYSGVADGGDYFCWNELDPTVYGKSWPAWDDARDPCRKLPGGQWHTPTLAQIQELVSVPKVMGEWIMADGTSVTGGYYGIASAPSAEQQSTLVFLPLISYRQSDGSMNNGASIVSYYWSKEPHLTFSGKTVKVPWSSDLLEGGIANMGRGSGNPIRCVQDK